MTRQPAGRRRDPWQSGARKITLNVNKMKELIVDFRKKQREVAPIHIDGTAVEKVESFMFLG
jgi:hypothetical protein